MAEITELKVNYDEMKDGLNALRDAVLAFDSVYANAFNTDRGNMDAMNSDFIKIFSRVLECMPVWLREDMMERLKKFCDDTELVMTLIQEADEAHNTERVEENNG